MIRSGVLALGMLLTLSAYAEGQDRPGNRDPGPVETLLGLRSDLDLSTDQVARLTEIDADLDRQNRPFVEQMMQIRRQIRGLGPRSEFDRDRRVRYESLRAEAGTVLRQIEVNNRAAMKQVGSILSDSQKQHLRQLLRQRGSNGDRSGQSPRVPRDRN